MQGWTALHVATFRAKDFAMDVIECLLNAQANVNAQELMNVSPASVYAC